MAAGRHRRAPRAPLRGAEELLRHLTLQGSPPRRRGCRACTAAAGVGALPPRGRGPHATSSLLFSCHLSRSVTEPTIQLIPQKPLILNGVKKRE